MKPTAVVWGFFGIELAALALQGAGAGTSVSSDGPPTNAALGKSLLITGLVALVVLIACYLCTAIYVHLKPIYGVRQSHSMRRLFAVLWVTLPPLETCHAFGPSQRGLLHKILAIFPVI